MDLPNVACIWLGKGRSTNVHVRSCRRRNATLDLRAKPRCGSPLQISGGTQHKGSFGSYLHRSHGQNFALLLPLEVQLAILCKKVGFFFFRLIKQTNPPPQTSRTETTTSSAAACLLLKTARGKGKTVLGMTLDLCVHQAHKLPSTCDAKL